MYGYGYLRRGITRIVYGIAEATEDNGFLIFIAILIVILIAYYIIRFKPFKK